MTAFMRLLEVSVDEKGAALRDAIIGLATGRETAVGPAPVFAREPETFAEVPGSPFAYWVSDDIRRIFKTFTPFEKLGERAARSASILQRSVEMPATRR